VKLSSVYVFGAGKVGRALSRGLRRAGVGTQLRRARKGWPRRRIAAELVVLAVRDGDIEQYATELADAELLADGTTVVHCAGSLGLEVLASLRALNISVAQMHPLLAFASVKHSPPWTDAAMRIEGDPAATRMARAVALHLGMRPLDLSAIDSSTYHAAAALCANGAVALLDASAQLLQAGGCTPRMATELLGPLLTSVSFNVQQLSLPAALTGPVRRGDSTAVRAHLRRLSSDAPALLPLYRALTEVQLRMARELNEASSESFSDIAAALIER